MRVLVGLCVLVGCTYPEKTFDGPYTCLGAAPPTTADPLVKLSGQAADPSNLAPLAGVTVVLQDANMGPIFTTTTDAMGNFNFALNTNRTPVTGVDVFASGSGRVNTYFYPARSVTHDLTVALAVLSTMEAGSVVLGATGAPLVAGDGAILLTVNDCNGAPITGAKITSSPPGTVRYFNGIQPSMTATATDAGGVAMICNLAPGKVTVTATADANVLPPRTFTVVADAFIQTEIQP